MNINVTYDSSVSSAPAGFTAAVQAAVQYYDSIFTNSVTINIDVGYGEVAGSALGSGVLGESDTIPTYSYTYAQLKSALLAEGAPGSASLPSSDPTGGKTLVMATAEAKALGLLGASSAVDGYVGFSSGVPFDYNGSDRAVSGEYDFIGGVEHEISEVMGRLSVQDYSGYYTPLDLFRYSAPNTRQLSTGALSYFSIDNGTTDLNNFNNFVTGDSGDLGDWAPSASPDSYLDATGPGVENPVTPTDVTEMGALGWVPAQGAIGAPSFDTTWQVAGIVDANADGDADLFWERPTDGTIDIQFMSGSTTLATGSLTNNAFGAGWSVVAIGHFTGTSETDLLWQRQADGFTEIQRLNSTDEIGGGVITNTGIGTGWNVIATGDFNGDGKTDLLWQRRSDGLVEMQFLNGTQGIGGGVITNTGIGAGWKVIGTGDFNGDGETDLAWQRQSDGLVEIQFLNGTQGIGGGVIANNPFGAGWSVAATGDFNGDGKTDLVWQNQSSGLVEIQFLDGAQAIGGGTITNNAFGAGWSVVGAGDFNGDGKADLVWRQAGTGLTEIQLLNGTTAIGGGLAAWGGAMAASSSDQISQSAQQLVQAMAALPAGSAGLVSNPLVNTSNAATQNTLLATPHV